MVDLYTNTSACYAHTTTLFEEWQTEFRKWEMTRLQLHSTIVWKTIATVLLALMLSDNINMSSTIYLLRNWVYLTITEPVWCSFSHILAGRIQSSMTVLNLQKIRTSFASVFFVDFRFDFVKLTHSIKSLSFTDHIAARACIGSHMFVFR